MLFFELIQVAVGTRDVLSRIPTSDEWERIYAEAQKQALTGVCFMGLNRYSSNILATSELGLCSSSQWLGKLNLTKSMYYDWVGLSMQIQQTNEAMDRKCVSVQKHFLDAGIRSSILKGQAVALLYGDLKSCRQSGDIDVYVDCGREKAVGFARSVGQKEVQWDYKHLHLKVYRQTEVEVHYRVEVSFNLVRNRKLQRWFESPEIQDRIFHDNGELVSPSVEFNGFYILLHFFRHFLSEGVGMRQLMDVYYTWSNLKDPAFVKDAVRRFGMEKFAGAVSWVIGTVFAPGDIVQIAEPDEREGRFLLDEIMAGGNFGTHDERLDDRLKGRFGAVIRILAHNLHLVFHYPGEVLWAPVWIVYHWFWKRFQKV